MKGIAALGILVIAAVLLCSSVGAQRANEPADSSGEESLPSKPELQTPDYFRTAQNPPEVNYKDDQLTISANDSSLGAILVAVRACVGVKIDVPEGANRSRVFDQLGPGSVREVLTALLNGTNFNYLIGTSAADPRKVETILVLERATDSKTADKENDRPLNAARRAWKQNLQGGRIAAGDNDDSRVAAVAEAESPAQEPALASMNEGASSPHPETSEESQPPASVDTAKTAPASVQTAPAGTPALNQDKSTPERINDMQQMFEQRRQMIENQNATPRQ